MNRAWAARDYIVLNMNAADDRVIDELLVIRCQAADAKCFDLLTRRWQRRLWSYAHRLTGNPDAAWDVTQEAWLVILRQIRRLSDPAWFGAWAHRIVRNKAVDHNRANRRRRDLAVGLAQRRLPSADSDKTETSDELSAALQQLTPDERELLFLKYTEQLNVFELAMVLGIPAGTVKSRLYHAREQLKRILTGETP